MPRFRIKSLLVFTAMIAVGIFLWIRFVAPQIAGVAVQDSKLLVYFNRPSRGLADPYDYESFGPGGTPFFWSVNEPDGLFRYAFTVIEIPLLVIGTVLGICAILIFGHPFRLYWLGRKLISRKAPPPDG